MLLAQLARSGMTQALIDAAAGAVQLRRLAIRLLSGADADPQILSNVQLESWRLFLIEEGIASALTDRLRRRELIDMLPSDVRAELDQRAMAETQRLLAASAQLSQLAKVAERRGWEIVVLKGGVHVAEGGEALYLGDLDVLVRDDVALALADELRKLGYSGGEDAGGYHLGASSIAGGIPVEIHRRWDRDALEVDESWWTEAVPLPKHPALRRPGRVDHVFHLLVHAVEHHAELRGRLRDLRVIGNAVHALTDAAHLDALRARITSHAMQAELTRVLEMASSPRTPGAREPFEARAAGRYVLRYLIERGRIPQSLRGQLTALVLSILDHDVAYYARRILPSIWREGRRVRNASLPERLLTQVLRVIRRIFAQAAVVAIAPLLASLARRALARSGAPPLTPGNGLKP